MKPREQNIYDLAKAGLSARDIEDLQKIARILHRLDEAHCNGYSNTDWGRNREALDEKKEERMEKQGKAIADKYELNFFRQGDPRGWPVYLLDAETAKKADSLYDRGLAVCPS